MLKGIAIRILIAVFACLMAATSFSQKQEDKFYVFDSKWKPAPIDKASFLMRFRKTNDSSYNLLTYILFGPRISQENYIDEEATIRHGKCIYYHSNGFRDSAGIFVRGIINGEWSYWNWDGNLNRKKVYDNGVLLSDSIYEVKNDTPSTKLARLAGETRSSFTGGPSSWMRFLNKNFTYPQRAANHYIQGTVQLQFIVDRDGSILEPEIIKSIEFSLDEETLRIIKLSPKWQPAIQDGNVLKSYKVQPITFALQRE